MLVAQGKAQYPTAATHAIYSEESASEFTLDMVTVANGLVAELLNDPKTIAGIQTLHVKLSSPDKIDTQLVGSTLNVDALRRRIKKYDVTNETNSYTSCSDTASSETHHSLFDQPRVLNGGESIAFSPNGRTIALGGPDSTLWDVDRGQQLHELATQNAAGHDYSVAFSPDGSLIASVTEGDSHIYLWNVAAGRELRALDCKCYGGFFSVAFSPNGQTLATVFDNEVRIWDVASGQQLHILEVADEFVFSPDSRMIVDDHLDLWDVGTGKKLRTLQSYGKDPVSSVAFSPDGHKIAVGHCVEYDMLNQTTIELQNVADGQELWTLRVPFGCIASMAFSPDGRILAVGGAKGPVSYPEMIETGNGKPLNILLEPVDNVMRVQCAGCGLTGVAFSGDGRTFAAARRGSTVLWRVANSP